MLSCKGLVEWAVLTVAAAALVVTGVGMGIVEGVVVVTAHAREKPGCSPALRPQAENHCRQCRTADPAVEAAKETSCNCHENQKAPIYQDNTNICSPVRECLFFLSPV